jgi:hypothetical protein
VQTRKPRPIGPGLYFNQSNRLLAGGGELRVDVGEGALELRTERVDDGDDGNRNAGCDQAVFDRGRDDALI